MQSSIRAVESYRRSRLIDGVTADDGKTAPVYKLDEIFSTMRAGPLDVVKEMLEHILKRLENKSPLVKQKTLRLIKFAAGKAGPEIRREMQRQAGPVRNLFHYRGNLDALKGDAANKAVRDTAHDAVSAIFASNEKISAMEEAGKRIHGFGSTNLDMPSLEGKKTMFSGMVGFGSSTIRQSISMMSGGGSVGTSSTEVGSYKGPSLRRSLSAEHKKLFEKDDLTDPELSLEISDAKIRCTSSGPHSSEVEHGKGRGNSQEEQLVDLVTAPGGVRVQPSRDTIQTFLSAAGNLDAVSLGHALEAKLRAHSWQVRLKAMCIAEALLCQRENKVFGTVAAIFGEDARAILECTQSPQGSLREKAKKVLDLLGLGSKGEEGELPQGKAGHVPPLLGSTPPPCTPVPDLIDTREFDFSTASNGSQGISSVAKQEELLRDIAGATSSSSKVPDDWLGGLQWSDNTEYVMTGSMGGDPFPAISSHSSIAPAVRVGAETNLFPHLDVDRDGTPGSNGTVKWLGQVGGGSKSLFEGLTVSSAEMTASKQSPARIDCLAGLMGGLSSETPMSERHVPDPLQSLSALNFSMQQPVGMMPAPSLNRGSDPSFSPNTGSDLFNQGFGALIPEPSPEVSMPLPGFGLPPQMYKNAAVLTNLGRAGGGFPQHNLLQQPFPPCALGYGGMNAALAQQPLAAGLASTRRFGMGMDVRPGVAPQANLGAASGLAHLHNDSFDFSSDATPRYSAVGTKKEDTKAFDFITDHVSAFLGPKRSK